MNKNIRYIHVSKKGNEKHLPWSVLFRGNDFVSLDSRENTFFRFQTGQQAVALASTMQHSMPPNPGVMLVVDSEVEPMTEDWEEDEELYTTERDFVRT